MHRQERKTWLQAGLRITLAAFIVLGFTLATYDTAAAETRPCAVPAWITEDSHIPQEVIDQICALIPSDNTVTTKAPAWVTHGSYCPLTAPAADAHGEPDCEDHTDAHETMHQDVNSASTTPPANDVYNPIHWEVHQKATGTTEYRGP